jgi:hypothetical protein
VADTPPRYMILTCGRGRGYDIRDRKHASIVISHLNRKKDAESLLNLLNADESAEAGGLARVKAGRDAVKLLDYFVNLFAYYVKYDKPIAGTDAVDQIVDLVRRGRKIVAAYEGKGVPRG